MTASNNGDSTTHPLANDHRHNNHNHAGQPPSNNSVPNGLSAPSNLDQNHAGAMAAAAAPAVSAPPLAAPTTITTTITTSTTTNAANNSAPTPLRRPSASEMTAETYQFPISRLRRRQRDAGRTPIVLVACGSFSPITCVQRPETRFEPEERGGAGGTGRGVSARRMRQVVRDAGTGVARHGQRG